MKQVDYKKYHRDSDYNKFENLFSNIFQKRFNIVSKYFKTPGKVLDIGASNGLMLDLFKNHGWQTWGVEPSKNGQIANEKGHKILSDYFETCRLPKNAFDLVIANHTLEHMDNPSQVLLKIYGLLKKGGLVLIDVPNAGGLGSNILGSNWPYRLPLEHKHQFTKNSLSELFTKAGFDIIHFESRSGLFEFASPVLELWQAAKGLKKRFVTDLLLFPYAFVATLLNRGDSMSIVGRK